jgi:hypothetical protein
MPSVLFLHSQEQPVSLQFVPEDWPIPFSASWNPGTDVKQSVNIGEFFTMEA